jgi:5-methylthioadenosine/S-adenosylhomocysteine deaminase
MSKLLLTSDTVLPISSPPLKDSGVLIVDGIIRDIGPASKLKRDYSGVRTRELGSGVLLPGFINAHVHLELGWIKEKIGSFEGFTGWLKQIIEAKREAIAEQTILDSVKDGVKELIASGVTTVGEISSYGGIDKQLLKDSGLRTILFREVLDSKEETCDFTEFENGPLLEERLFPHALYSCSPGLLKKVLESNKRNNIPLGIHLAESPEETEFVRRKENGIESNIFPIIKKEPVSRDKADTPFSYLRSMGFFEGTKVSAVHMVQVEPEEVEEIRARDVGVILCPRSNFFLQVGVPPVKQYDELDRVGLATDGLSSNYNLNYFEELRVLHLLMSLSLGKKAAYKAVYAATLGGAKALYIEDKTGSIEKGKEADLIFLKSYNQSSDPYMSVVSSTNDILEMLMVRGNILYART